MNTETTQASHTLGSRDAHAAAHALLAQNKRLWQALDFAMPFVPMPKGTERPEYIEAYNAARAALEAADNDDCPGCGCAGERGCPCACHIERARRTARAALEEGA